jgi:hypothetical protein
LSIDIPFPAPPTVPIAVVDSTVPGDDAPATVPVTVSNEHDGAVPPVVPLPPLPVVPEADPVVPDTEWV